METNDKVAMLLNQLVSMFHFAALQQMGKLKNPMTDKIEQDLQQSRVSIDMLEMLHTKMQGNLTAEEERFLSDVLKELRLNYVDEVRKSQTVPAGQDQTAPATPDAQP